MRLLFIVTLLLIQSCVSTETKEPPALHEAAQQGNIPLLTQLLSTPLNVNERADIKIQLPGKTRKSRLRYATALHAAAYSGSIEAVKLLINKRIDINARTRARANRRSKEYNIPHITAEHVAARMGHLNILKFLHEYPSRTHAQSDYNQWTPMHIAARHHQLEVVKYLLEKGADINSLVKRGYNAAYLAAVSGDMNMLNFLIQNQADFQLVSDKGLTLMYAAAKGGNLEMIKALHLKGLAINTSSEQGKTPLHIASQKGHTDIVQFLLDNGADINARTHKRQWTALHYAQKKKQHKVIDLLIKNNADTSLRDNKNRLYSEINSPRKSSNQYSSTQNTAGEKSMPAECLKLAAALRVCQEAGGFMQKICELGAESQFDCPIPVHKLF